MIETTPVPERWLPAPRWEGYYEVSDLGRVRSVPHETEMGLRGGHVLKPGTYQSGHKHVTFTRTTDTGKDRETFQVHRLVMLTFADPCPDGQQVRHLDGDPANNRWAPGDDEAAVIAAGGNLFYGTPKENAEDRDERHGRNYHSNKTRCPQGHLYNEKNTYWYKGARQCRACRNGGRPAEDCTKPDCHDAIKAQGLCNKHYQRLLRSRFSPEKRKEVKAANREQARASRKRRNDMSAIDTLF